MQKVSITCPFTGLEFEAVEYADGRFIATNVITGEDVHISYNPSIDRYLVPKGAFKHEPLMTLGECAELLDVSKPRVTALVNSGKIKAVRPGSSVYVTKNSVLEYRCKRNREKAV